MNSDIDIPLPDGTEDQDYLAAIGDQLPDVLDQLTRPEQRRIGLPATSALVQRTWLAVGGTLLTARLALRYGLANHLAGGTHHAHPGFGSGFCIFNDCAVAARVLLRRHEVEKILIVDLDVHQGDGSAACFQADERVTTFSVHAASNFPLRKVNSCLLYTSDAADE